MLLADPYDKKVKNPYGIGGADTNPDGAINSGDQLRRALMAMLPIGQPQMVGGNLGAVPPFGVVSPYAPRGSQPVAGPYIDHSPVPNPHNPVFMRDPLAGQHGGLDGSPPSIPGYPIQPPYRRPIDPGYHEDPIDRIRPGDPRLGDQGGTPKYPSMTPIGGWNPQPARHPQPPQSRRRMWGRQPQRFEDGGEMDFAASSEGGTNMNIMEPAQVVGVHSGRVYATLAEHDPEQLIVKPLPSVLKKKKEQEKAQQDGMKRMAEGGTATVGGDSQSGFIEALRTQLRNLIPGLQMPSNNQGLPDTRFLAPIYGRLQNDSDLYDLVKSGYSRLGIPDKTLDYTLKSYQPQGIPGSPSVSYR